MRVILSGGGTGGHIYPALSTAEALQPHVEAMLFLGSASGPECDLVRSFGWEFVGLPAAPLSRSPLGMMKALGSAGLGIVRALQVMRQFRPDVVIGTGGYASLAAGLAAGVLRVPLLLEAPDAVPGRATRLLSPLASRIATAFPGPERRLPVSKIVRTGFPVRKGTTGGSAEAARKRWELRPDLPVLLVYGGSQGALTINLAVETGLARWEAAGIQTIHSVGKKLYRPEYAAFLRKEYPSYRPVPYIEGMADAFAVADLVVCRGGASSIAEVTACGKPSILIPYPHHADQHQVVNAETVEAAEAGVKVNNEEAVAVLPTLVVSLMADTALMGKMADASRRMGRPDAAEAVAQEVLKLVT